MQLVSEWRLVLHHVVGMTTRIFRYMIYDILTIAPTAPDLTRCIHYRAVDHFHLHNLDHLETPESPANLIRSHHDVCSALGLCKQKSNRFISG
jgi:hypothetical protein